jgi:hypothetical protein
MEEGPEPHEWVERAAEEHRHSEAHEDLPERMVPAITAAVLAVFAAFGSLLSGHAANEAILAQTRATDQWAFFQAKSTKEQIFDVGSQVVNALTEETAQVDRARPALVRLRGEVQRYEREKEEIRREAERWEEEGRHEYRKHTRFALGIALFQVGIVLASVSLLVRIRWLHASSLVTGGRRPGVSDRRAAQLAWSRWCPIFSAGSPPQPASLQIDRLRMRCGPTPIVGAGLNPFRVASH